MRLFITGTDTGVGKTYVASLLLRSITAAGKLAAGFKPICCGDRADAESLLASGDPALSLNDVNPVWLRAPAAPYTASMVENRPIDLDLVRESFARLSARYDNLIIEGVGGWRVPVLRDLDMADLAAEFGLPVAVVVANRLGAINHTLLTLDSIRSRGVQCAGIILNHPDTTASVATASNRAILEDLAGVPVLHDIFPGQTELDL